MDTIPEPTDTTPPRLDRDAARLILDRYAFGIADISDALPSYEALDALEECVRPVPPATIDRDILLDLINFVVVNYYIVDDAEAIRLADDVLAQMVPDPRFDAIAAHSALQPAHDDDGPLVDAILRMLTYYEMWDDERIEAQDRLHAIRQLHRAVTRGGPDDQVCSQCWDYENSTAEVWPCATVRALNGGQDAH